MTEQEVFHRLCPLIEEVTGVPVADVRMQHVLMSDLGAESLDLLDLSFLIEEQFGITLESDEFEQDVKDRHPGIIYERDGFLTDQALAEMRNALPEIRPDRLLGPLRKTEVPALLTVSVFVHLVQRKLTAKNQEPAHA